MNSTFLIDNTTLTMLSAFMPSGQCWGEYSTIVLGVLLFVSEALPFVRQKSKCQGQDVIHFDEAIPADKIEVEQLERKGSILQEANGVLHTLLAIYENGKKK
tara:strand:+ start:452 stop:757 length:306 start_codon:yes stop_codon:yes gene_type:complete